MTPVIAPDLAVIAQISITLAGFTGLVGVFQARGGMVLSNRQAFHIANLLMTSAFVVFLSFVPSWILLFPESNGNVWLWSIRVLFVTHVIGWLVVLPFLLRGGLLLQNFRGVDRALILATGPLGLIAVVIEGCMSAGLWAPYVPFTYEGILILLLVAAMGNFLTLLLRP